MTLEPVPSKIDETVEHIFVPEGSKLARMVTNEQGEIVLDPDGPDIPDQFTGDSIDVGAVVAEFAALAIDPYPRKPDAEFAVKGEKEPELKTAFALCRAERLEKRLNAPGGGIILL